MHLFWDAPFRTLFWDQNLLEGIVTSLFDITWNEYATSPLNDKIIQGIIRGFGWFYLIVGIIALFIKAKHRFLAWLLPLSTFFLTFLAYLYCKEKFHHIGQFFEYSLQIISPLMLYLLLFRNAYLKVLFNIGAVAAGLTFVCHGLYAFGYYPRPGKFVDMTINILHVKEPTAHALLWTAGLLDFLVVAGLFIRPIRSWCLGYMFLWGTVTALARVWSGMNIPFFWENIHQNLADTVYRLPHGLIPLVLLIWGLKVQGLKSKVN